jgi:hypothetical protein
MPDQYDWGLWFAGDQRSLPHSYVYRRDLNLQAGKTYHFQTRNLTSGWFGRPDPVMYLVRGNDIVDFNDDYTGLASEIIHTPTVTGTHRIVIRAYTTSTPGYCDVYQGVDGAPPTLLEANAMFGGTYVWARWKAGEWFETGNAGSGYVGLRSTNPPISDPYTFLIVGSKMYWDDDGAGYPHSKIVPPSEGTGTVILGSFSRHTGGECLLGLVGQSSMTPWMSPAPWAFQQEPAILTPTMTEYLGELQRQKPDLEERSPDERDQVVLELQRRLLTEDEVRQLRAPVPVASRELVGRQDAFLDRYGQMDRDVEEMSYDERTAQLAQLKRETMGIEYSEPESDRYADGKKGDAQRGT